MTLTLQTAFSDFGANAKKKLANPVVTGQPEDQLRAPFEQLLGDLATLLKYPSSAVVPVGESSLSDLKTRPDYAVTVHGALVGFIELKAPGKGSDPRKYKDPHDKAQWDKLRSLPNIMYSDGNGFSLWQNGELVGKVLRLIGDVESSGSDLQANPIVLPLFEQFLGWEPIPPKSAKELAHVSARLCRFLRDEVTEQLSLKSDALTALAEDWRTLLFPDATDESFADGYAQAVTFGMLMARAKNIKLETGLGEVAEQLGQTSSLIGAALKLLTDDAESQRSLQTSLETLKRVLDAVDWSGISKGDPETWLYFYEDFLEVYDNKLRRQTGSYYTPPEVVGAMVALVDEALRSPRYGLFDGIASPKVTLADPATGTGTFLLAILRKIAETIEADQGGGAVGAAINEAVKRLIAFEIQLGPFAVAQLRVLAEIVELTGALPTTAPRMFVTDTLGNPGVDEGWIPASGTLGRIGKSRKDANKIKREEPITVVIGNPPYREKAKGLGSWVEGENKQAEKSAPLTDWLPPKGWKLGAHSKHLRNLYVYFWRWATWKVYDHGPGSKSGIVCFITVAGFLSGPGFQKMRDYLRRTCDDIWVIDCSPEGYQPGVNTRIFQGVQQPICIVLASRSAETDAEVPANVRFQQLPIGHRSQKFVALSSMTLAGSAWIECPSAWRAAFLPASVGAWSTYAALEDFFLYNGSGVMPGRTWVIAPDAGSLKQRWETLIQASADQKELLFHPHLQGDRDTKRVITSGLAGYPPRPEPIAAEEGTCSPPIRYGFRSFDRQWIIPDNRLINRPNPELWGSWSKAQVFLTAFAEESPKNGPALTFTGLIPDIHHYKGSFGGRVFPMWRDAAAKAPNVRPLLLAFLTDTYAENVTPEDIVAYIAAVAANPAYTARFQDDLSTPGLRIPITADRETFVEAVELGRRVIWLQTFGERMTDPGNGRPPQSPRLAPARSPKIPATGAVPGESSRMPNTIDYDASKKRLLVGEGYVENVEPQVWHYEVDGTQVLLHWFSYRKADRNRPILGDRRPPSPLGDIQPDHWLAEYTTELIDVLNVLQMLVDLEPTQAALLEKICSGPTISRDELENAGAFEGTTEPTSRKPMAKGPQLFAD